MHACVDANTFCGKERVIHLLACVLAFAAVRVSVCGIEKFCNGSVMVDCFCHEMYAGRVLGHFWSLAANLGCVTSHRLLVEYPSANGPKWQNHHYHPVPPRLGRSRKSW